MGQSVELPEGFVLDEQIGLPDGFVLDSSLYPGAFPEVPALNEPLSARQEEQGGEQFNPVAAPILEFIAGANNAAADLIDFLGPDQANAILQLAGSDKRVPSVKDSEFVRSATIGGFMDQGLGRDVMRAAGGTATVGGVTGGLLRQAANKLPALKSGAESVSTGVLRQMGATSPALDLGAGSAAGGGSQVGGEFGEYVAGEDGRAVGEVVGSFAAPLAIPEKLGGIGPLASTIRRIIRPDAKKVASVIEDFKVVQSTPTVGQATGRPSIQGAENLLGQVPGGGPITRRAESIRRNIQGRLKSMARSTSKQEGLDAAGLALKKGITGQGGFVDRFNAKSSDLWGKVDDFVPASSLVSMNNTAKAVDDLIIKGEFGSILNNPKIVQIKKVLDQGESIAFEELKALRSFIGRELSGTNLSPDIPRAQLKQIYGALSDDTKAAVETVGPKALKAWTRANNHTRAGHKRLDNYVKRIAGKGDLQKVYEAVIRGTEDVATINAFKRSLQPEEWNIVASNALRQMGKATAGQQNAEGDVFSVSKFLTDWNRLGPKARKAVFSGTPQLNAYSRDMDKIAKVSEAVKESLKVSANPSGTAQAVANYATASAVTGAAISGKAKLVANILGIVGINNGAARLMTSPKFVNWLARTPSEPAKLQAHIAGLAAIANKSNLDESMAIYDLMSELEQESGESL
jgi:hypothetical protein